LNETNDGDRIKVLTVYIDKLLEISQRLANTNDKKNIMTEAKELFYDGAFLQKMDNNPHLLCFTNGVVDFKQKAFRRGVPEDYLSKCTNIEFRTIDRVRDAPIISEIETFMHQLFPVTQLCEYMWAHLASTLLGTAGNQTFHMYIGQGQNGKSVLVSLMEMVLGEYKGDVPLSLLTDRRTKIGGLAPELVALKGVRYAVMQEPQKGDRINEGVMKQLTSGVDPIQARAPYMTNVLTFIPQFKLAVCSNEFMEIKSQDHGTWRRIRVVDFVSLFTENPVANDPTNPYQFKLDLELKDEKFPKWKQVFAAMLVERVFQTDGKLPECEIVKASSQSYRQRQDYISEFIADKVIEDPNGTITKVELNAEFTLWYQSTYGRGGPNQKDVQAYMDKLFAKCNKRKVWTGVRIRYERDEQDTQNDIDDEDIGEAELLDY
jgi:P4 family phage/plasmid primase-like protien